MKKAGLLLFATTFALQVLNAQTPAYLPTQNLVGWWPLNGNLIDSSVNTNDGSGLTFTYQSDRFGLPNKACDFTNNGHAQFLNLPVNTNGGYTINYWMKLNSYEEFDVAMDFHPSDACGSYPQIWERFDSLHIVKCGIVPSRVPLGHKNFFLNNWVMMTHKIRPDSTFIYINGTLRAQVPYTWNSSINANLIIGNAYNYSQQYLTGANVTLDDIGLWTKILTDCEISSLFNSTPLLAVTTQPSSQNGTTGGSVSFSIAVNNASSTYQWQSNIGTGGNFINLSNGGQYSGVTSNTLTISNLTAFNNNQLFKCLVNGSEAACDTATSNTASLSVTPTGINDHDYYAGSVLEQNVPNPAADQTVINYYVPTFKNNANILVCDAGGRKVWSGNIAQRGKGQFTLSHQELEQGIYFYSLIIDGFKASTKKMIIIR